MIVRNISTSAFYYYCYYCYYYYYYYYYCMYWGSSWASREAFQPKMPYYAKMAACPMKNRGMIFTFMWNLESLFIRNLTYTSLMLGHGQRLVHHTCLTWDFLNTWTSCTCTRLLPAFLSTCLTWDFPNIIIIVIELTHSKIILENIVEIEPKPVALDFKNLSQYSSCSK